MKLVQLLVLCALSMSLAAASTPFTATDTESSYKKYSCDDFMLEYPNDWGVIVQTIEGGSTPGVPAEMDTTQYMFYDMMGSIFNPDMIIVQVAEFGDDNDVATGSDEKYYSIMFGESMVTAAGKFNPALGHVINTLSIIN